ncbi:hypothetical protein ACFL37_01800 [Candidatus Margulisiibacteriota bacterium]
MDDNKKKFIGLTIFSTILSLLGVVLYKLFPRMKQCCQDMKDKCCSDPECCQPKEKKSKRHRGK